MQNIKVHSDGRNEPAHFCLSVRVGVFLGGVHTRGGTTSSVFHGCIQLDAGGGTAALEQSGCSQPE